MMRDSGNSGGGYGGAAQAQIRPVDFTRTENQLRPFDGFKPEEVSPRSAPHPSSADGYTMRLAEPPKWTHRDDLPCTKVVPRSNGRDLFDTNDKVRAKALCAGCPVRLACLADAMEEEGDLSGRARYLVRGGLTPEERGKLAALPDEATDLQILGKSDPTRS